MNFTKYFKSLLMLGILFLAFSYADANANVTNKVNTTTTWTASDSSITSENYGPHRRHPRRHGRFWRRHHGRRHW